MTWDIGIQVFGMLIQLIVAIATLLKLIQTHNAFNSKMDAALQAQRSLGEAEGRLGEQASKRIRDAEAALPKSQIDETIIK